MSALPAPAAPASDSAAPSGPSALAAEVLQGTGTAAGYFLGHGNVIADSVSISSNQGALREGRDFWLDAADGAIFFARPVAPFDSLTVFYRYSTAPVQAGAGGGAPGFRLSFGRSTTLGLLYGMDSGAGGAASAYGLALNSSFGGGGLSHYSGLFYLTSARMPSALSLTSGPPQASPQSGSDHLIVQDAQIRSGRLEADLGYQDVGARFSGFSALRLNSGSDAALLSRLTELQQQTGMRRMSLGLLYALGSGRAGAGQPALGFSALSVRDKSGGLRRMALSLASKGLNLAYLDQRTDAGFARIAALSDADRKAMALDLVRQYDPRASATQVGAADLAQLTHEVGFERRSLAGDLALGKTGSLTFSDLRVSDVQAAAKSQSQPAFHRESVGLETGGFALDYTARHTDTGFGRLAGLSDMEKNYLALDVRRQFDPNAKLADITQKERDQVSSEVGLNREDLRSRLSLGRVGALSWTSMRLWSDAPGADRSGAANAIDRTTLGFAGRSLQLTWVDQAISEGFGKLSSLSDLEKAQFANEHGLDKQQLTLLWTPVRAIQVGFTSLSVGSTPDAVQAALAAAQKDPAKLQETARSVSARLRRDTITVRALGLQLTANLADTGKEFARAADLALPDADRKSVEAERGFRRGDMTLHFDRIRGLTLDTTEYNAADPLDALRHNTYKRSLVYSPLKSMTLSYTADSDVAAAAGAANGLQHSLLAYKQQIGTGAELDLSRDDSVTYAKGAIANSVGTDALHFQTAPNKPDTLLFDDKRTVLQNGTMDNTLDVNVHAKPASTLTFEYSKHAVDSTEGPQDPSLNTDTLDFQWQSTKTFAVTGGVSQTDVSSKQSANTVSVGLLGDPAKNVSLTAKFNEVHADGKDTKDTADFAVSNGKPLNVGPVQGLTISAHYAALNDQCKLQNETVTGVAAWKLWKNEFRLDYGGLTKQPGQSTFTREYFFQTDPDKRRWLHATFRYKDRTTLDHKEQLIRYYAVDARLSRASTFSYVFSTLPEDAAGNVTPSTSEDVSLKNLLHKTLSSELFYRLADNTATRILTRSLGLSLEGTLAHDAKLSFAYSLDTNGFATTYGRGHHFRLAFDKQVSADRGLSLSADLGDHVGAGLLNQAQANLAFHARF